MIFVKGAVKILLLLFYPSCCGFRRPKDYSVRRDYPFFAFPKALIEPISSSNQ